MLTGTGKVIEMSGKNVIFLDIDGVLNRFGTKARTPNGYQGIEESKVKILAQIRDEIDADIVLSSSWKSEWDPVYNNCSSDGKYLVDMLAECNIEIKDKTTDLYGPRFRGSAIRHYLETHEHGCWIVLDDEIFPDFKMCKIHPHLIRTSGVDGLKNKYVQVASRMIDRQLRNPEEFAFAGLEAVKEETRRIARYEKQRIDDMLDHFGRYL